MLAVMEKETQYALITGASKGLGYELARALARRNINLLLVALPGEDLAGKSKIIKNDYGVSVFWFECDLTREKELNDLVLWVKENYTINMLINNAGMGCTTKFSQTSRQEIDQILLLNIRSVALLTHGLLPLLANQHQSYILNIASLAAFLPMPYKSVYPASKAFVYSFSRGLCAELKDTNVFVSVAHPGGMATNPDVCRRISKADWFTRATILSIEKTAEICVRGLLKKQPLIIPGAMNKMVWLLTRLSPVSLQLRYLRSDFRKEITSTQKSDIIFTKEKS